MVIVGHLDRYIDKEKTMTQLAKEASGSQLQTINVIHGIVDL